MASLSSITFWLIFLLCWSPWISSPLALGLGVGLGLASYLSLPRWRHRLATVLLQICIVGLGFNMDLVEILQVGSTGTLYTALSLLGVLALGLWLGKVMKVRRRDSFLITVGTAICGGSAIATVGPLLDAREEEMSISLGTVFLLNAIALFLFPLVGSWAGLSQEQFGLWSALAIHDTSSVVAAGSRYGATALAVGTTIKLARSLWIIPMSLGLAYVERRNRVTIKWPWFIGLFLLAALLNSLLPIGQPLFTSIHALARSGLTATLFLIGSGISLQNLREIGCRPLLQGVTLWIGVSLVSLLLIRSNILSAPVFP